MAEARDHSHFVYQDIDLKKNNIENVRKVSSDDDLTLAAGSGKDIVSKSPTYFEKKVTIDAQSNNEVSLDVKGTSLLEKDVIIGEFAGDNTQTLTVASVKIRWDSDSNSLIFEKVQTSNG